MHFSVAAYCHPKGIVILPSVSYRSSQRRFSLGPLVFAHDASPEGLGEGTLTAFSRSQWGLSAFGQAKTSDEAATFAQNMREALGLSEKAPLWSRMDLVNLRLENDLLTLTPTENAGRGGFGSRKPPALVVTAWPEDPVRIGLLLRAAFKLCT